MSTMQAQLFLLLYLCPHTAYSTITVGINFSGLEDTNKIPGRPNIDFAVPTEAEWAYFKSKNITLVRLPFRWERLQPTIKGPLDPDYVGLIKKQLGMAQNYSMRVILDCHNFAEAFGHKLNNASDGANQLTSSDFADLWLKVSTELKGSLAIVGYDIMNEPNNMPSPMSWPSAAQAAINAIRTIDQTTAIYVEGEHWSGTETWSKSNPYLHNLTDLSCVNPQFVPNTHGGMGCIVWSGHCYLDRDGSGTHFNWTAEVAAGITTNTGAQRLADFSAWLKQYNFKHAHIGEMGTGNDNLGWLESLHNAMIVMNNNSWQFTYWSAGPWFAGGYGYDVDVQLVEANGTKVPKDSVQMAVLSKFSGAQAPRIYFLDGPNRGRTGAASLPFFLTYRGYVDKTINFQCDISWLDGSHKTSALQATCEPGYNCYFEFNVTVKYSQQHKLECTNSAGLKDAPPLMYNSSSDLFGGCSAPAANVFSLRNFYTGYNGPLIRLRRSIDNATKNFSAAMDSDDLDVVAIRSWCSPPSCRMFVDTWFDQSPNRWHAGNVTSDFHGGANKNVSIADQPELLIAGDLDGQESQKAHIHFDGTRRMDAKSPIDDNPGQTILAVLSANGTGSAVNNSDRLLSWAFVQNVEFPGDGGYVTPDSSTPLSLNISHVPGWHRYAGRWIGGVVDGKSTFKDGTLTAVSPTIDSTVLRFEYRDTVNLGWFRWWGPVTVADVRELVVFSDAASNYDLEAFDDNESAWLNN